MSLVLRAATPEDIVAIQRLGVEADARFVAAGHPELADETSIPTEAAERAVAQGRLRVAELHGVVVGWAYTARLDGELCLGQISVAIEAGRRGVGSALLRELTERARADGEPSIVLNTQRDVAWNAPWYARHGFIEVPRDEWSPTLAALAADQTRDGLDWTTRVHMRLRLK